jgi:putative ABC transport system permease protein
MTYLGFVLANLGRNKLRTALTGGAIMLAVMLVCLLLTMPAGFDALLNTIASNTRISVHHKAGVVYTMPYAFTAKVRQLPGVAAAVSTLWFGGAFEQEGRVTFPTLVVEADQIGAVYPDFEVPLEQLADFQRYRDGAIVGRQTMLRYGWKIGDRVTLRSTLWQLALDLRIVGEIPNDHSPLVWINREYADQALRAQYGTGLGVTGIIWVRATDPSQVNAIMASIDALSANSDAETASETEKSFISNLFGSLQGLVTIIDVVTTLVALCTVFVAANTASMAVRERVSEIAVLKSIGFDRRVIFGTLLAESVVLATLAGWMGVGAALALTRALKAMAAWNAVLAPLGGFTVTPLVIAAGAALSCVVGLISGMVPSYGAARRSVVEALHEVF